MYTPPYFKVSDPERLARFMEENSFATVVTHFEGAPFASHLPILIDRSSAFPGRLVGHMARANPQWTHFSGGSEILVIFHGPHAYVSPRWYQARIAVPTWNYAVVHAYGTPVVIEDESFLEDLLDRTISRFEGETQVAWRANFSEEIKSAFLKAIVGFEIRLTHLEGKFKLGQNRSKGDLLGVYAALRLSSSPDDARLADMMRSEGLSP